MKSRSQFGGWLAALVFVCAVALAPDCAFSQAQRRKAQVRPNANKQRKAPEQKSGGAQNDNAQQRSQNPRQFQPGQFDGPPAILQRLRQMPPRDQERFLNNNPRFRQLPPERQAQVRQNLRRWNSMSPQQQQEMIRREEAWRKMTPEQRQHVREELFPRLGQLEPYRRQAIMRRWRALGDMSEEERAAKLKDEAFLSGLNDDDRELLRELSKLRLPPPEPHDPQDQEEPLL